MDSLLEYFANFVAEVLHDCADESLGRIDTSIAEVHELLRCEQNEKVSLLQRYKAFQLAKFLALYQAHEPFETLCQPLDMIIIVCGPDSEILTIMGLLESQFDSSHLNYELTPFILALDQPHRQFQGNPHIKTLDSQLLILEEPSIEVFILHSHEPFILLSIMNDWPAMKRWSDPEYLLRTAGHRLVPIEFGCSYMDSDWSQEIMTIRSFIEKHVCQNSGPIAYLAQYDLLSAVPRLAEDVRDLDYMYLDLDSSSREEPVRNIWIGGPSCYSPLHFDERNNIFCQIVGRKQFRLFRPDFCSIIDPNISSALGKNTIQLASAYDSETLPQIEVILEPGTALFIPKGWWHEVKSLSYSISLSHWF